MKKFLALSLIGSSVIFGSNPAKAEWDTYGVSSIGSTGLTIKRCTSSDGSCSSGVTRTSTFMSITPSESWVDEENNLILVIEEQRTSSDSRTHKLLKFNGKTDSFTDLGSNWRRDFGTTFNKFAVTKNSDGSVQIGADGNDIDVVADGLNIDGDAVITKNSDGTIQIGTDENDIDITSEGLAVDGEPLITKKANGELHIGKNSWITKEENGRQKVYAKDAAGNPIPIDYTNGTKLLINGRDVEQSINNVGALSAALTGLPTVPTDTTLACGFGTGTHGGDFAFAGGCASKVNETLSVNYAASMTMPGQDYAGDFEDTFSARAGFVWKLGKPVNSELISIKEKEFQTKIISLEEKNQELLARLERLEKVALGKVGSKDLASNTSNYQEMNKRLTFKKISK